ncbi:MAG: ornithine cyclodeaminase family protein [Ktedonobacterales bacterium]
MTLVLREDDVRAVLTMPGVVDVLDAALRLQGAGRTRNQPRTRIVEPEPPHGVLHVLSAYVPGQPGHPEREGPGLMGLKAYTGFPSGVRFAVLLYSGDDGRLLALVEADWLGQMRTGAASGVATRYLARPDARTACLIGTGGQARTQALALCAVRSITRLLVYGRSVERREAFAAELARQVSADVVAVGSAEEAVRDADIVVTATTAREPVLRGAWLRPGTHVNAMGSNWHNRREVDAEALERSAVVAVDALDQARIEAGDLIIAERESRFDWGRAVELGHVIGGDAPGRTGAEQITLFKSLGIGLEDVATAGLVYALARERGLGEELRLLP